MPRVLWVTHEPPDHDGSGGQIRQAHLLDALAGRADVDLLLAGDLADERVHAACRSVTEVPVELDRRGRHRRRLDRYVTFLAQRDPQELVESARIRQSLRSRLDVQGYDVVNVEHAELAPLARERGPGAAFWTLDLHHLISRRSQQLALAARGAREATFRRHEARRASELEARLARDFHRVIVCSAEDAAELPFEAAVIPNGVDLDRYQPTPLPVGPRIVFTGHLSYWPNVDAVRWFVHEVLPIVKKRVPNVSLSIVGRRPPTEIMELTADAPHIQVEADPPTIVPHLEAARPAIVPIRAGSGTRLKALEAMAAGRPVVGTRVGLEGLGIEHGRHAYIADDPRSFADAVTQVLENDRLAAGMAASARQLAERFGWREIGDRFAEIMLQ